MTAKGIAAHAKIKMDKHQANVHPEIIMGTLIEDHRTGLAWGAKRPGDGMLFLGSRITTFPVRVVQDRVLEPVDKLVWMIILLQARPAAHKLPFRVTTSSRRRPISPQVNRRTLAGGAAFHALVDSLCPGSQRSGRYGGNVYALHDAPLSLADVLHLDNGYMAFLKMHKHAHARYNGWRRVCWRLDTEIRNGVDVCAGHHPSTQGRAVVKSNANGGYSPRGLKQGSKPSDTQAAIGQHPEPSQMRTPRRIQTARSWGRRFHWSTQKIDKTSGR